VFEGRGLAQRGDELIRFDSRFEIGDKRRDVGADGQQLGVERADRLCVEVVLEEQHPIAQRPEHGLDPGAAWTRNQPRP
jgi:hypothetical protein